MRPDDMIAKAIKSAAEAKVARATKVKVTTLPAQYMGTDSEGKGWVMLPGAAGPTPVRRMAVEAKAGDTVAVTVGYGRAVVDSNISNPSAGVAGVTTVRRTAQQAQSTATEAAKDAQAAIGYATSARAAANDARSQADVAAASAQQASQDAQTAYAAAQSATTDAATARTMAEQATTDAGIARESAAAAVADAATARDAATQAQSDAESAATSAANAEASASSAATSASGAATSAANAATSAGNAESSASAAAQSASTAQAQATAAKTAADEAKADAATAKSQAASAVADATTAKQAATEATATANGAVTALATVQGVVDQLEDDVDELQVHVAMMGAYSDGHGGTVPAGLHVVPTGAGYFLVIANDGTYVYDAQSVLVTKFGESIDFSSTRPQRIGNSTAYVEYYDSDNDGVPDAIRISGTNLNAEIANINTAIATKADGSTVTALTTRVSNVEQDVSGFKTTVASTYATKTELGTTQSTLQGEIDAKADGADLTALTTRVSTAETTIEQHDSSIALKANSSDVYTKTAMDGLIATEVTNRNAAITAKANEIASSVSQTYATKDAVSGIDTRLTTAESSITQQAGQIALKANAADVNTKAETTALLEVKANKDTLTSEINASADTAKIAANRVNIEGAAIFTSGRLSQSSLDGAYDAAGAASSAVGALTADLASSSGTTVIDGGHISTNSLTVGHVSGLQGTLDGKASTASVAEAAKRTYVSVRATAIDYAAGTATLEATLYVDGAALTTGVSYEWMVDGAAISGAASRTYSVPAATGLAHAFSCCVTY